jgi:hypothetical protein
MARHCDILVGEPVANSDETVSGSLAESIQTLIDGKTVVAMTAAPYGRLTAVIIVWDDPA